MKNQLREFNPEIRENLLTWQCAYIQTLLEHAPVSKNSSAVIYACFETRNLLEKIEFDMVQASMNKHQRSHYFKLMTRVDGTKKAFDSLDDSFHAYYTYLKALCKVGGLPEPSDFDMKTSRKFRTKLNDYCHLYSNSDADFVYGSTFLSTGLQICKDVLEYLVKCSLIQTNGSITIIGTTVSELEQKSGGLYSKWKKKIIKTEEELITELRKRVTTN